MLQREQDVRKILFEALDRLETMDIGLKSDLATIGMDSLNFVKFFVKLEEFYGITIPIEYMNFELFQTVEKTCNTLNDIINERA
jgi:acyl carrier protein